MNFGRHGALSERYSFPDFRAWQGGNAWDAALFAVREARR